MLRVVKENAVTIVIALVTFIGTISGNYVSERVERALQSDSITKYEQNIDKLMSSQQQILNNVTVYADRLDNLFKMNAEQNLKIDNLEDKVIALERDQAVTEQMMTDLSSSISSLSKSADTLSKVVVDVARQDERLKMLEGVK